MIRMIGSFNRLRSIPLRRSRPDLFSNTGPQYAWERRSCNARLPPLSLKRSAFMMRLFFLLGFTSGLRLGRRGRLELFMPGYKLIDEMTRVYNGYNLQDEKYGS